MKQSIGDFLLRRLKEAGIRHLFGVPGDYNLELLQQLQDSGALKWIGTCSELNASYAADGYARVNGLGALLVTNGVGALRCPRTRFTPAATRWTSAMTTIKR